MALEEWDRLGEDGSGTGKATQALTVYGKQLIVEHYGPWIMAHS